MKLLKTYFEYVNESGTENAQRLIDKIKGEADSAKMRTGGTADKLPWAMTFIVGNAAAAKLQSDMAAGKFNVADPNTLAQYKEEFYKGIEAQQTDLITKALDVLIQNGLDPEAAKKLSQDPAQEEAQPEQPIEQAPPPPPPTVAEQPAPAPAGAPPQAQLPPPSPTSESVVNEAWKLVNIKPETLRVEEKKPEKSATEKEFRTAFNHTRNLVRKYLV